MRAACIAALVLAGAGCWGTPPLPELSPDSVGVLRSLGYLE